MSIISAVVLSKHNLNPYTCIFTQKHPNTLLHAALRIIRDQESYNTGNMFSGLCIQQLSSWEERTSSHSDLSIIKISYIKIYYQNFIKYYVQFTSVGISALNLNTHTLLLIVISYTNPNTVGTSFLLEGR